MKKIVILTIASLCSIIVACGGSNSQSDRISNDSTRATDQTAASHNSEAVQDTTGRIGTENTGTSVSSSSAGAQLIAKNDCLSCHKEHDKLVGPSYAAVAEKYKSEDINKLADKIIKGGAGSFGDIPMSPHPSLSADDAKEMVKYILTVK
jgi:cytochrome c